MKKDKLQNWIELVRHIDEKWKKKKNSEVSYPFTGKDFNDLKHFAHHYTPFGIMALYDVYISRTDEFAIRTGFSLWHFFRQLPFLVDDPNWKMMKMKYEEKFKPAEQLPLLTDFVNMIKSHTLSTKERRRERTANRKWDSGLSGSA